MSSAEEAELTKLVKEVISTLKLIFVLMSILLAVVAPTCFIYLGSRTTDLGCFGKGSERARLAECMSQKKPASECLEEARVACVLEE